MLNKTLNCTLISASVQSGLMKCRTALSNHLTPRPIFSLAIAEMYGKEASIANRHQCVTTGEDKRTGEAIIAVGWCCVVFQGPWHWDTGSLRSRFPLNRPEEHRRQTQLPKHSSIRTFWLLARPWRWLTCVAFGKEVVLLVVSPYLSL